LDHRQALETQVAERYLLGELPAVEAEEFELHYFECPQCALAVESGQMFIDGARESRAAEELAKPAVPAARRESPSFWQSLAAFWRQPAFGLIAAAALAAIVLYQGAVVIPGLRQARVLPAFHLMGASRAEDQKITPPAGSPFVQLDADIPPDVHFRNYICVISGGGKSLPAIISPAPEDGHPVTILVPTSQLSPGKHEMAIYGEGTETKPVQTYPFDFEIH
jgi:anti-sigma factor RsiW